MVRWIRLVMRVLDSWEFLFPLLLVAIIVALLFLVEFLTRTRPVHLTQT